MNIYISVGLPFIEALNSEVFGGCAYDFGMVIPEARPKHKSNIISMVRLYKARSEIFK